MIPGSTDLLNSWELEHAPNATEKSGPVGKPVEGFQRRFTVPLGPPLLVDGATYKQVVYIAPCDGCYLKEAWGAAAVAPAGGTNTIALTAVDAGGGADRVMLSAATLDPLSFFDATGGADALTLSTTYGYRVLDEGDILIAILVCGTQTVNGEGLALGFTVIEPAAL